MMNKDDKATVQVNGTAYRWPKQPVVVVVCIDGGDPAYLQQGLKTAR